ncbi:MAG: YdeI/OmpD-associated family protein [Thermoanaerobaculia bacterium]|jgi:uncharacterized protein YdeI (YjbR/CyaY-like superfamily)
MADSPRFFENAAAFRAWLERNASREAELVVGFHKVGSGRPSMTWPESVDEALCFGWIDGVRKRIDEHSYLIRFTPRRKGSIWSAINVAKVEKLAAAGRMRPGGLAAFALRTEQKTRVYSYEQEGVLPFSDDELRSLKRSKRAWSYFEQLPPGYRRTILHWVVSAKRPETRARRFATLVESCEQGKRLL